jgi:hypothetical protein
MSNYLLWGGRHNSPGYMALMLPTPQDWIIYFLEVPNTVQLSISSFSLRPLRRLRYPAGSRSVYVKKIDFNKEF